MSYSVYNLKDFYSKRPGRLVRRLLSAHIHEVWPDITDLQLMGYGYPLPYLRGYRERAARVYSLLPRQIGAHFWPEQDKGLVTLCDEAELPIETESVDRLLVVHGLEYAESPGPLLDELWRILKSNGRILFIVPNRLGLWSRVEHTPFGHGTPYTQGQMNHYLHQHLFITEQTDRGLFMPPFRSFLVLRTAYTFESFGKFIFPGFAGVHIIEASKQIYAGISASEKEKRAARRVIVGTPVPG